MSATDPTPAGVDWHALADRLQTATADMVHHDTGPQRYGSDFYAEALRRVFEAHPAHEPGGRDLPYDRVSTQTGMITTAEHTWLLDSHTIHNRLALESADATIRELRAEIRRVYAEARQDIAAALREWCNERSVPSRFRREGVLLAAQRLDPRPADHGERRTA